MIQCEGELALLDEDEVIHSIGSGSTDKLTSFFESPAALAPSPSHGPGRRKANTPSVTEEAKPKENDAEQTENNAEATEDGTEANADQETEGQEDDAADEAFEEPNEVNGEDTKANEGDADGGDVNENEENIEDNDQEKGGGANEDGGFGVKKKSGKKPQTGLLKEILDAKPGKRH